MAPATGRFLAILLGSLLAGAIVFFGWLHGAVLEKPRDVDLGRVGPMPVGDGARTLRIAVAPVWSPEHAIDDYQALVDRLAVRIGRPFRVVQRKTYGEVNELLRHGMVQAAIICTGAYLEAQRSRISLEVAAVPLFPEGPVYRSLLVTRADGGPATVADLRGRAFAFSDPLSLSGHYYPIDLLRSEGEDYRRYFSRTLFTHSHSGSLHAVLDGIADGAAVDSLVYESEAERNPDLAHRLRVIHRSPPLGINPVVVPGAADPAFRAAFREALIGLHGTPEGRLALDRIGIKRFVVPPAGLYESAAGIYERVRDFLEGRP